MIEYRSGGWHIALRKMSLHPLDVVVIHQTERVRYVWVPVSNRNGDTELQGPRWVAPL